MKNLSTGTGLALLAGAILAFPVVNASVTSANAGSVATSTAVGAAAFAQAGERHVVSAGVRELSNNVIYAYRIWSDNAIDVRPLSQLNISYQNWPNSCTGQSYNFYSWTNYEGVPECHGGANNGWRTLDNGTSGFRPLTDVDMSGTVDGGDLAKVLGDWDERQDDLPPPPIDCNINAPNP
jgi:hypothetical protein